MTETTSTQHLKSAVETAQSVTEGLADPQLRSIAFGKVLEHLLIAGTSTPLTVSREHAPVVANRQRNRPRPTVSDGPTAWVDILRTEGFFASPKSLADVTEAVCAQGQKVESKNVTEPLEKLVKSRTLKRERKPTEGQKRGVWMYVNA